MSVGERKAAVITEVEAGQIIRAWLRRLLDTKLIGIHAMLASYSG
jgi:hypothetical protein